MGVKCVSGSKVRRGGVRAVARANMNPLVLGILRTSMKPVVSVLMNISDTWVGGYRQCV
jgi:hypothetical protein